MGGTAKKNLVMFKNLCGKNALKNVILVTTMWSEIALEKGDEREAELVATPEFWGWMMGKGSRICRHTGDRQSAMSILKYFVDQNSQVVLDIQDQMVNQDKSLNETSAGIELGHELIREREKFQAELQQVQQDMAKAIKERDEETRDELRELRDEYTSKIESLSKQKDDLQVNMQKLHEEQSRELEQRMRTQEENHRRELEAVAEKHEDALKELRRLALSPSSPKRTGASSSAAEVPGAQVKRQMKTKLEYGTRVAAICGDGYYIIRDGKTTW
jgi:seryl-tRNA synthetase